MKKYTCPCCGYKTIEREDTFYDLCPVCFWETDPYQLANPAYSGGANRPSLQEAQQNFILFGACEKEVFAYTRLPLVDEVKDENWQPFEANLEDTLFFKRHWNETTGNPLTDAWKTSTYYFQTDKEGEVLKQIDVFDNHKILKYSNLCIEDDFGGLATVALDLLDTGYLPIPKDAFFSIWNKPLISTFTAKKVHLAGWHIAVYDSEINTFAPQLKIDKTIISATLDHRFMLDLTFQKGEDHFPRNGFFVLNIREGNTGIHYFTYMNWDEAATATQQFIDEINEINKTIDTKKTSEEIVFDVRVNIDNQMVMSKLTTWRNMDWDVEKFRNIQLEIQDEVYSIIDTFTDFENMLLALQKSLPKNHKIETCFFCRFSSYAVSGNDNFGDLDCFKNCKEKFLLVNDKHKLIDLYEAEKNRIVKVEETHFCIKFEPQKPTDWLYKHQIN